MRYWFSKSINNCVTVRCQLVAAPWLCVCMCVCVRACVRARVRFGKLDIHDRSSHGQTNATNGVRGGCGLGMPRFPVHLYGLSCPYSIVSCREVSFTDSVAAFFHADSYFSEKAFKPKVRPLFLHCRQAQHQVELKNVSLWPCTGGGPPGAV